ncbi:MAG: heme-copper oxidase subunit III [Leptospiraceae bacterium]|nr:heme-copper oxidase subunit III [Leptospiraceae bacterium]MCK6379732.1 heme-copper oxidase subunit III [Leptospiraceae bacterium]NUM41683.1 heme-copper oxidase subunit III [Leptospiraceae bacterium]
MSATNKEIAMKSEIIPSAYLGMIMYLFTEVMFFSALISAYIVGKAGSMVPWPPENQPRLPVEITFFNTLILIFSSFTMYFIFRSNEKQKIQKLLLATILLGTTFLLIQGYEWVRLIGFGMTTTSNLFAGFFYTIVGAHGLHVVIGVVALSYSLYRFNQSNDLSESRVSLQAVGIYWFFVVYLWPFLYYLLYLY